jgi:hypothetical protein
MLRHASPVRTGGATSVPPAGTGMKFTVLVEDTAAGDLRRHRKHYVFLCFQYSVSLVLEVDQGDAEAYLQQLYPIATKIVYLPHSFSSVAKFLAHKPVIDSNIIESTEIISQRQTKAFYLSSANDAKAWWSQK